VGVEQHKGMKVAAKCAVVTVSDTRSEATDESGQWIVDRLAQSGHRIDFYRVIPDEPGIIHQTLCELLNCSEIEVIVLTGGTGIASRDSTFEVVQPLLEKVLPGFGEIFRYLSYTQDVGSAAMLSRAVAGVARGKSMFSLPGSLGAVRLAVEKLIEPELGHLLHELRKS